MRSLEAGAAFDPRRQLVPDLSRRHAQQDRRAAAVQEGRLPDGDEGAGADRAGRGVRAARDAMRRGSKIIRPATVSIRVGEPIETAGMEHERSRRADRHACASGLRRCSPKGRCRLSRQRRSMKGSGLRAQGFALARVRLVAAGASLAPAAPRSHARSRNRRSRPSAPKPTTSASTSIRPGRRAGHRSHAGRLRDPRRRRRRRRSSSSSTSSSAAAGRRTRASSRTPSPNRGDGAEPARARVRRCSSTPTTSTSSGSHSIRKPLVDALDRADRPGRSRRGHDAGDVRRATSPSRARRRRSTGS